MFHDSQKQVFSPKDYFSVTEALYANGIFKYEWKFCAQNLEEMFFYKDSTQRY